MKKNNEKRIAEIEERLSQITKDNELNGVLVYKYIKCGKEGCHCEDGKKHGPYLHLQTYDKKTKKIKTKYIKKSEEEIYKEKFAENKEYNKLMKELMKLKK